MASANFRKSSSQHQSFLVKNVEVAVEHTCHPCPLYINLWHWYFPTVFCLRIQSSDWRPSGKIMSAPASTYAAACTDWANFRMQIDAVKCCQCFSLVTHTASFLSSMSGVVALSTALSKPSPGLVGEKVTSGKKPANRNGALITVKCLHWYDMQYTGLHTITIIHTWTVSKGTEGIKVRPHRRCRASAEGGVN